MKVATTYDNGTVFQHFGHSEHFKVYEVEADKIISSEVIGTNGTGHGALAGLLKDLGVMALICGGIGAGARQALDTAGIEVYGGVSGDADKAAQALIEGTLAFDPAAKCDHHGHGDGEHRHSGNREGHGCGSHGCH